jgi:hypothetical protein
MRTTSAYAELRAAYECDGYAIARTSLDAGLVEEARGHVAWLREKNPGLRPEQLGHTLVAGDPFWVRPHLSDDRLLDVAEAFVGPNIALFASHYIAKPPGDGSRCCGTRTGATAARPDGVVTLWLALDDATPRTAACASSPARTAATCSRCGAAPTSANVLSSEIDPALVDESRAVDIVLGPGDVSIHHPRTSSTAPTRTHPTGGAAG